MPEYPFLEIAVGTRSGEAHSVLLLEQPVDNRHIGLETGVLFMGRRNGKAAAINAIHPDVDQLQIGGLQNSRNYAERVVFDVFVANCVVRIEAQQAAATHSPAAIPAASICRKSCVPSTAVPATAVKKPTPRP